MNRPGLDVSVVMRRERLESRWQPWRWVLDEVRPSDPTQTGGPLLIQDDKDIQRWLHTGYRVELFRDDAEGYHLNATTPAPCWFVMWRMEEEATVAPEPIARPEIVTLSYHDAGRWLDAQETVEQVPAPPEVIDWMRAFADAHLIQEPKKRRRPDSFRPLTDRFGNPASVSTGWKRGGGGGGQGGEGGGHG